jgi:hypothetical protein
MLGFKDHSEEFQSDHRTSLRKRKREAPLLNPHCIRIHAAVSGILHMSVAGRLFDELLAKFGDQDGSSTVRSWEQFDEMVETLMLRKSLSVLAVH